MSKHKTKHKSTQSNSKKSRGKSKSQKPNDDLTALELETKNRLAAYLHKAQPTANQTACHPEPSDNAHQDKLRRGIPSSQVTPGMIEGSEAITTISLDPWQRDSVDSLAQGKNLVVDAPTTAGKTRVVEYFFSQHVHESDFRACYTCPVKSLTNDKVKEFRSLYGYNSVGVSTGDIKENLNAPIVVATLESYRNSLLGVEPDLGRYLVVFDEYHFLQEDGRGSAWEEAIILTPPTCQIVMMSASPSNGQEFADWIGSISGRKTEFIQVKERPVPLVNLVWYKDHWLFSDTLDHTILESQRQPIRLPVEELVRRLAALIELELTPCIVYAGKRHSCTEIALELKKSLTPLPKEHSQLIGEKLLQAQKEYSALSLMKPGLREMLQIYGVAYHHSGHTPQVRLAIEMLLKEGLLRFCVATMGLSLGINFSVRSTIISDHSRPGEFGMTPYSASEIMQMSGRAGRRGKDAVGFRLWYDVFEFKKKSDLKRQPCSSRLKSDPTTFLGLISRGYTLSLIEDFYKKSFLRYKQPNVDVSIMSYTKLLNHLGKNSELPCSSPLHEIAHFELKKTSLCTSCPYQKKCHPFVGRFNPGFIARLHLHLHVIGALDEHEGLSPFGLVARYFPHTGGLLIAEKIARGEVTEQNLIEIIQLMAAFGVAKFKKLNVPESYRFPFKASVIKKRMKELYPADLFPEEYDESYETHELDIREFNPHAGYIVREWVEGRSFEELINKVTTDRFGPGDVTGIIFRTASYLQSLIQSHEGAPIGVYAKEMRKELLRHPLSVLL